MVECVPNFSEGRDAQKVSRIVSAIAATPETLVLHQTSDADHNRSVITFAGPPEAVFQSALAAAAAARDLIDLRAQRGAHPRLGALDVLPFVPLDGHTLEDCVQLAHEAGERIWRELRVPVYFYEAAARRPDRRKLEDVRRGEFEALSRESLVNEAKQPDIGGPGLHPTAGAVIVGARKFLIAFNINLKSNDIRVAREIARRIRTSSGGFPAVKALGLLLESRNMAQVSMNLTDFEQTGLDVVFGEVERLAREQGVEIAESELIGLMPRQALEQAAARMLKIDNFQSRRIVENAVEVMRR
jgi:glutamate formiminotransferase